MALNCQSVEYEYFMGFDIIFHDKFTILLQFLLNLDNIATFYYLDIHSLIIFFTIYQSLTMIPFKKLNKCNFWFFKQKKATTSSFGVSDTYGFERNDVSNKFVSLHIKSLS